MVQGAQYSAGRPTGMKKKRGRYAPIIEEGAKQGLATKMVASGKERALQKEQWDFQKSSRESELAMQKKQLGMQQDKMKFDKTMGWVNAGIGALSTGLEVVDMFSDWLD